MLNTLPSSMELKEESRRDRSFLFVLILPAISLFTVFGSLHGFLPVIWDFILKVIFVMPTSIEPRCLVVTDLDEQITLL